MSIRFVKIGHLAERIVGEPDGRPLDASDHQEAFEALQDLEARLDRLMQQCAQALYDDAPLMLDGGAGPVPAHTPALVLDVVAEIVGMTGPFPRVDVLREAGEVTPR